MSPKYWLRWFLLSHSVCPIEVHEGEYKGRDKLTAKPVFSFIEDDDERDAAPIVGYMAYLEMTNGFRKVVYWTKKKMLDHADTYSSAFSRSAYEKIQNGEIPERDMWKYSSFWYKDFNEMAKKTMLRQIITKWGVMSSELVDAFNNDGSVIEVGADNGLIGTPESAWELAEPEAIEIVPTLTGIFIRSPSLSLLQKRSTSQAWTAS